jgi:hypothetical protein
MLLIADQEIVGYIGTAGTMPESSLHQQSDTGGQNCGKRLQVISQESSQYQTVTNK